MKRHNKLSRVMSCISLIHSDSSRAEICCQMTSSYYVILFATSHILPASKSYSHSLDGKKTSSITFLLCAISVKSIECCTVDVATMQFFSIALILKIYYHEIKLLHFFTFFMYFIYHRKASQRIPKHAHFKVFFCCISLQSYAR